MVICGAEMMIDDYALLCAIVQAIENCIVF